MKPLIRIRAFRKAEKKQKLLLLLWSNMIQNVAFWMQTFFIFWHIFKRLIQNHTRCINFFQNLTHREFPNLKSWFLKLEKCKRCRFLAVTFFNTCFLNVSFFLKSETFRTVFFQFMKRSVFIFSKFDAVKFLIQNHAFRRSTKNWKYVVFTM